MLDPLQGTVGIELRAALDEAGDSSHETTIDRWHEIAQREGFVRVMTVPFVRKPFSDLAGVVEEEEFWWKEDEALLLVIDTWQGRKANRATLYYNSRVSPPAPSHGSGCGKGSAWCGSIDVREGFAYHIANIREHGQFVAPWVGYFYIHLVAGSLGMLPEKVRRGIRVLPDNKTS